MLVNDELRILQNNLRKGRERTHGILSCPDTKDFTILLLQEQHWSHPQKSSPIHHRWTLYEPAARNDKEPRTAIYVNNAYLTAGQVTQVQMPFNDVTAVQIKTKDSKPTLIVNVYNPGDESIITDLHTHLQRLTNNNQYGIIIIAGDFNCQHPAWNAREYIRHDEEANKLIEMAAELGMSLLLPPGTITYPIAGTTIDLVWGNDEALRRMIKCRIAKKHDQGSDHLPIETIISMETEKPQPQYAYNYAKTNWKEFGHKLRTYLPDATLPLANQASIDTYTEKLTQAISKAVQETTPRKRPSPHSKRWWNENVTQARRSANKLRNIYMRTKHEEDKKAWRKKADEYTKEISKAKTAKWREYVNGADNKSIFQIKKYITNTPTQAIIPTLNGNLSTHEEKVAAFQKTFFPPPPRADLSDIQTKLAYPSEAPYEPIITITQIRDSIRKLAPDKAPGPDEIPNRVLQHALPDIEHHLQKLMQASLEMGYFPKAFKETTTIVLRKPGKPDYTKPNAYRPIALENTLGKVFESIITSTLSYLTEMHGLLPPQHYGGRPGRSTEDAMLVLSENIYEAWKEKKIFTAVFMDVTGAFNNVHHRRLIHNLRKRHVPEIITRWIGSFLH